MTSRQLNDSKASALQNGSQTTSDDPGGTRIHAAFLLPGLSGDLDELSALLPATSEALNLLPIRYPHWSTLQRNPTEFDRLVSHCLGQIDRHGTFDTILLAGYSFGGLVAWAVAKQIAVTRNQTVLLGLIDASSVPRIQRPPAAETRGWGRLVGGARRGETGEQVARLLAKILYRLGLRLTRPLFHMMRKLHLFPRMVRLVDLNIQMRHYVILMQECAARIASADKRLHYPAILFRGGARSHTDGDDLGWRRVLDKLEVIAMSGNHLSVLDDRNADMIRRRLAGMLPEPMDNHAHS
jgi:thioesterase domain-containing protein